jgi:hypothetical protein
VFTDADVNTAIALIDYGILTLEEIPQGDFKTAVQNAMTQ